MRRKRDKDGSNIILALSLVLITIVAWPLQSNARPRPHDPIVKFVPELKKDQTLTYEIHGRVQRHVKTQSRVASILGPRDDKEEYFVQLHVKIMDVGPGSGLPVVKGRAEFEYPDADAESAPPTDKHAVEFTIGENGEARNLAGFEELAPIEQMAWQFWVSHFAFGWTLPSQNMKRGQKWKAEEPERAPSPIARLFWERETTYGQSETCPVISAETCGVFFTSSRLKQKSSPKDSTPDDYKLRDLLTSGTVTGTNEMYTTISQRTGIVERGTEEVRQSMKVAIVKTDGSNGVAYTMEAASHFEMMLIVEGASPSK